jgi:CRP-like cAMP-binding protein
MFRAEQLVGETMERRADFVRVRVAIAASIHFRDIAPHDLDRIAALGRLRAFKDGQAAPPDGGHGRHFFIVVHGCIRLSSPGPSGREFVYALLGPGSFYGIGNVIRGIDTRAEARASGATELAMMDGAAFLKLLDETPHLWQAVAVLLHRRLTHAMWAIRDNSIAPLKDRLVRRLLALAAGSGAALNGSRDISLRLSQSDLGRMLGTSRSRINGILKRLEHDGLVRVGYRTIRLTDAAALYKLAGSDVFAF